jgi:hypothetical protein
MNVTSTSSVAATIIASISQETTETEAQTKAEAARGDHQAIQKLARQQALAGKSAAATPSVPQPAADATIGKLNATA